MQTMQKYLFFTLLIGVTNLYGVNELDYKTSLSSYLKKSPNTPKTRKHKIYLTNSQKTLKNIVLKTSKKYTKHVSTILAIAMTESSLRNIKGDKGKSLGITQLQVGTIRFITKRDSSLNFLKRYSNKQIETFLMKHPDLCVLITCKLFEYYRKRYSYTEAISRYNGGKHNTKYVKRVLYWKKRFS